ncbi:hypothetical protein [Antrihabitans sp. YC2-6]|uniref:hypothetical protein n=1 Tax=Antrihabitans sp. YC2-6 TaxID=2799498 RepID=UPI0018F3E680|nr:hypothetical protein [Antrihabitans sp. YC2-6]MBJ8346855.1 hypothetical protein [Antrihabitans sp. YC2-6]
MAEDNRTDEQASPDEPKQPAPVVAQSGRWHASRAVQIVVAVLAAIVIGGVGFAAGLAAGGHDHDRHGPHIRMIHDEMGPGMPFGGEMRRGPMQGDNAPPPQPPSPSPSTPANPAPSP